MKRAFAPALVLIAVVAALPRAQMRVVPLDEEQGHVALGLALRHLANVGVFMHTTAHPDDENNALLVMLNRGQGYRTALATATRGNGGQNEIGPEIFEALGVLRTGELAALHRFDGAEQYFTRAVDFGYSFSIEETFEKWGREEITADYVRLIRTIRPDVIVTLPPTGNAGGQHHMASAVITRDAYKLAGDPSKFPEQIRDGLRPWQPNKLYHSASFGFPGEPPAVGRVLRVDANVYDPLLGKSYGEIGAEARSMHKCQGMGQLLAASLPAVSYQLVETTLSGQMNKDETSLFDGVDGSLTSLTQYAGSRAPSELSEALTAISNHVQRAQRAFDGSNDAAAVGPLVDGLMAVRSLRRDLRAMSIDESGRFEIDFRLRYKEDEFQRAILTAEGLKVEAIADDGVVVPGQAVKVDTTVANRAAAPVSIGRVKLDGFDGDALCSMTALATGGFSFPRGGRGLSPAARGSTNPAARPELVDGRALTSVAPNQTAHCEPTVTVPSGARITEPYWHRKGEEGRYTFDPDAPFGLSTRPSPFRAQVTLGIAGPQGTVDITTTVPVEHRYEGDVFSGEKRTELLVVPGFSVRASPEIAIIPAASIRGNAGGTSISTAPSPDREIRVTVTNATARAAAADVHLEAPPGWRVAPPQQTVTFDREDEARTIRFQVKPASSATGGQFRVRAVATVGGASFDRGFQVVEYPHIRRYHIYAPAETTLEIADVRLPQNLRVGYVMGVGDQVPPAIEQLGARVEMIGPEELAWGNLSRFDVIVTGVRAYERREDLRANNSRLLDYVFNGGTVIVQYNKFEFNDAQYGPYPAVVSSNRITDELAPPKILEPHNPVFTTPNEIGEAAWKQWVQERGLYFLGEKDSRYHDLIELEDHFTYNPGPKRGALVEASYGKGHWVYVGLGLWRQLPAGTEGAYQLLANLLALGKARSGR